ncbi:sirohydrochlorin cobaltochelatase [Natranaerovirga hydrolytica]|uniref:Sirohydrochlorin cobaltochelatase n=1 Tax=Natranaerovirga hydrolytica TaxID=680378 RepID=A0A4R1MRE8_9FIRM|nr:sirohydrochlorin cobaltochelatase [Natranaerovirga hydrolytica]TCK92473.1 sirohydrochlorin cobaltochelatase [Natranaerovirga hydrolytica]
MVLIDKRIIITSFGSADKDKRLQSVEPFIEQVKENYPTYKVEQGLTSQVIIKKIKENEGITFYTPSQIIDQGIQEGVQEIHIQPLHIIAGIEYEKLIHMAQEYNNLTHIKVQVGKPLLADVNSYEIIANALSKHYPTYVGEGILLVGHGSKHISNHQYAFLQKIIDDKGLPIFIGNLMGTLNVHKAIEKMKQKGVFQVNVCPLLITIGKHMLNDIGGHHKDSVMSQLIKEGFIVDFVDKSILEYEEIQKLFLEHLKNIIEN